MLSRQDSDGPKPSIDEVGFQQGRFPKIRFSPRVAAVLAVAALLALPGSAAAWGASLPADEKLEQRGNDVRISWSQNRIQYCSFFNPSCDYPGGGEVQITVIRNSSQGSSINVGPVSISAGTVMDHGVGPGHYTYGTCTMVPEGPICSVWKVIDVASAPQSAPSPSAVPGPQQEVPKYILGFKTLHDLDSADTGDPIDNQQFDPSGNAIQHTTKGLMVWRKADNWTAFTDGYRTWLNGPDGLVDRLNTQRFRWEGDTAGHEILSG